MKVSEKERNKLIVEHAQLVKYAALRIIVRVPPNIQLDELISAGTMGLIDAIDKFDESKDVQFKTYAEFRIRGAILDELRALDWVPRTVRQKATLVSKTYAKLERELNRPVEDEEMAEELDITVDEFYKMLRDAAGISIVNFEDLGGSDKDGDDRDIYDCLADTNSNDPETEIKLKQIREIIAETIDTLPEKEKILISLYYYEELNMKEIGEVMGITESRVSQLHSKAALRLRARLLDTLG
ncbi:MAG: FliA/WhiG family RNA polymerase sigma factor [Nitrospinae bacterium]|nr:FliA/WhiG family RNA polymerase sigma factor [Nitrospinota bacterium]